MSLALVLPWFPILLAVAVGGRSLDRRQGMGFGILAAVFWVVVVQVTAGPAVLVAPWALATLIAGAVAIAAVGAWAGTTQLRNDNSAPPSTRTHRADSIEPTKEHAVFADAMCRFDDWLEAHRFSTDPWPEFGELLRVVLRDLCSATHVQPYRLLDEDEILIPLRAMELGDSDNFLSAREGIVGHVSTTGQAFIAGDPTHGALVEELANKSHEHIAWCFAVRQATRKIGVIKVGQLAQNAVANKPLLVATEALISLFWTTLNEVCRRRSAETCDPTSGVLSREPFLIEADRVLHSAYAHNEPVVVAVIALEGLRSMADKGHWELAGSLATEAAAVMCERLRADDRLGRFDDSRFLLLLRRVDSALGELIVRQLHGTLTELCSDQHRWYSDVQVRCGVCGTGTDKPSLQELISKSVSHCHQARQAGAAMRSDIESAEEPVGALASAAKVSP